MAVTINASTSAGLIQTADTTGNLNLQSNGTTIAALTSTGLAVTGAGTFSTTLGVTGTSTLAAVNASGAITSSDTTAATSAITGSIKTAGGIGVLKGIFAGSSSSRGTIDITGTSGAGPGLFFNDNQSGAQTYITGAVAANEYDIFDSTRGAYVLRATNAGAVTIPGTLGVTGTITPGQTTGIVGTTTNNNVQAGSVGEYISATVTTVTTGLTSTVPFNVTSISLTAGDWDVGGKTKSSGGGVGTFNSITGSVSLVSATQGDESAQANFGGLGAGGDPIVSPSVTLPVVRLSLAGTTTVYLVNTSSFSGTTYGASGAISARRVR